MSVIVSPITNHANRDHSHRTGWARMWAKCLDSKLAFNEDWSKETTVYLEHGMEFKENSKGVNVFLKDPKSWDKLAEKAEMISSFQGELYSLDIDCPDYGQRLKARVRDHSTSRYKNLDFDKISNICSKAKTIKQNDLSRKGLVFGDSHALSAWREDAFLCRNDGQTLNGAINTGFDSWVDRFNDGNLDFIRTYFGNIDIRHHICRLAKEKSEQRKITKELVKRYFSELSKIRDKYGIENIEVVAALPIENETRKLPKTGYYKGQPFWGSWQERDSVHQAFNQYCDILCENLGFKFITWPLDFYNENSELGFENMEKPRSVHITPRRYLWEAFGE